MSKMQGFGHKRVSEQKGKTPLPTQEQLEAELLRVKRANACRSVFRGTIFALVSVVAACDLLVATLWLPVFQDLWQLHDANAPRGRIRSGAQGFVV